MQALKTLCLSTPAVCLALIAAPGFARTVVNHADVLILPPGVNSGPGNERNPKIAAIKVFATSPSALVWDGKYTGYKTIDLCLTSPSGGFALKVQTTADGPVHTQPMAVKLRFRNSGGAPQEMLAAPGSTVNFSGGAPTNTDCLAPNARLEVGIDTSQALSSVAGAYAYNFQFSIQSQ